MTNLSAPAKQPATDQIDPAVWRMAMVIIIGALAVVFDTTIVSVAIHDLGTDLQVGVATIQWVSTGYLLAMFVTIPLAGWAQAVVGGKRLWIAALGVFLLGSVLCSLAWDAPSLIAFRVVQGIGGGVMMPLMATLIMQAAHGQHLGKLMSVVSLPAALGPILGPVLGGLILHIADWRWLFAVNIPFCVVGAALAARVLPRDEPVDPQHRPRLDLVGFLLLSPGVAAVVYGLSNVTGHGGFGRADVLVPLVAGLSLVTGFARWAVRRGGAALVDVRLFRHRPLASAAALLFLAGAVLYGAMLLMPLYWQQVRGEHALGAGLLLIPQGVGALVSRSLAGRLTDRLGGRLVGLGGFAVVLIGTVPFAFVGTDTSNVLLGAALLVRGMGLGAVTIPLMTIGYLGLERSDVPHASIISRVAMQVGGSFGTAVLAVILQRSAAGAQDLGALASAFGHAFWWATGFTVVAMLLCALLPGRKPAC